MPEHLYNATIEWTGNKGTGTTDYRSYERSHTISVDGKPVIEGSSDVNFRGDGSKYTPEDMFMISLSTCHMLWYLHLCAVNKIIIVDYKDEPVGTMQETADGGGFFSNVVLHPTIKVKDQSMIDAAIQLHEAAHKKCFIANSVNFPVTCRPAVTV